MHPKDLPVTVFPETVATLESITLIFVAPLIALEMSVVPPTATLLKRSTEESANMDTSLSIIVTLSFKTSLRFSSPLTSVFVSAAISEFVFTFELDTTGAIFILEEFDACDFPDEAFTVVLSALAVPAITGVEFLAVCSTTSLTSTSTVFATYSLISCSVYVVNESTTVPTVGSSDVMYSFTDVVVSVLPSAVAISVLTVSRTV